MAPIGRHSFRNAFRGLNLHRLSRHIDDIQSFNRVLEAFDLSLRFFGAMVNFELALHLLVLLSEVCTFLGLVALEQ